MRSGDVHVSKFSRNPISDPSLDTRTDAPPVDVLILTALSEELSAILDLDDGWIKQTARKARNHFTYHRCELGRSDGGTLVVAAACLDEIHDVGGLHLLVELDPEYVAMCGVCVGLDDTVALGDVIIADRLYRYEDDGRLVAGENEYVLDHNIRSYDLHPSWKNAFDKMKQEVDSLKLERDRPLSNPYYTGALLDETDIIIGRRGAGKSSLAGMIGMAQSATGRLFDICAHIDDSRPFRAAINELIQALPNESQPYLIDLLGEIWTHALWNVLIAQFDTHTIVPKSTDLGRYVKVLMNSVVPRPAEVVVRSLKRLANRAGKPATMKSLNDVLQEMNADPGFNAARAEVEAYLAKNRAAIVIDALDEYEMKNVQVQRCLAGLLRAVAALGRGGMHKNAIIKCFLPAEIYQEVVENVVQHQGKTFANSIAIHWRRKDLLRMVCWRMLFSLEQRQQLPHDLRDYRQLRWGDYDEIHRKVWSRFFPKPKIVQGNIPVDAFDYITRFTQLRPRQVIWICNEIAQEAERAGGFPGGITWDHVYDGVSVTVGHLAADVIGSFNPIYPDASWSLESTLSGQPQVLTFGNIESLSSRVKGVVGHDVSGFWRLLLEMGVVGIVQDRGGRYIDARYEYAVRHRLTPNTDMQFAIHPMFHHRLSILPAQDGRIVRPLGPDEDADRLEV